MGEEGQFLDLCKTGDISRLVNFMRTAPESVLEATDEMQARSGLHFAVENGHHAMVTHLLGKGAKVDARDRLLRTPLHLACLGGHGTIAELLLGRSADPFERDSAGRTSLHYAVCTASVIAALQLIQLLSANSRDVLHMKDHTGRTPLHYAIFNQ